MTVIVILSISFLAIFIATVYYFYSATKKINESERDLLTQINEHYPESKFEYFYNGHPNHWILVTSSELLTVIKRLSVGAQYIPIEPSYSLKLDKDTNKVYLGFGSSSFDFSTLKHNDRYQN